MMDEQNRTERVVLCCLVAWSFTMADTSCLSLPLFNTTYVLQCWAVEQLSSTSYPIPEFFSFLSSSSSLTLYFSQTKT